jgi:hypothetical protein
MAEVKEVGIARGLTNYGDRDFALYLRRSFIKSMGYSGEILKKPVVGIASSGSGFNNCHRSMPELAACWPQAPCPSSFRRSRWARCSSAPRA